MARKNYEKTSVNETSTVYRISNAETEDIYLGVTSRTLERRLRQHQYEAGYTCRYKLQKFMTEIGFDKFSISPLIICANRGAAFAVERWLVEEMEPSLNMISGGGGFLGRHSPETRAVMAAKATGRVSMVAWKGGKRSPEVCRRISEGLRKCEGIRRPRGPRSAETKLRISQSKAGKKRTYTPTPEHEAAFQEAVRILAESRRKPVLCITDGKVYVSARAAGAAYGILPATIGSACNGRLKTAHKRVFQWAGNN